MIKSPHPLAKIRTCKNKKDQYEMIDYDYLNKLSKQQQEFLATFTETHYEGIGSGRSKRRSDCYSMCSKTQAYSSDVDNLTPESILLILETINNK
jgi:hypothetical protein